MTADEVKRVKSTNKMDNETFLKHMNARHKGAAGIQHFGVSNVEGDGEEQLLRKMHAVLHRTPTTYGNVKDDDGTWSFDHTHGEAQEATE